MKTLRPLGSCAFTVVAMPPRVSGLSVFATSGRDSGSSDLRDVELTYSFGFHSKNSVLKVYYMEYENSELGVHFFYFILITNVILHLQEKIGLMTHITYATLFQK